MQTKDDDMRCTAGEEGKTEPGRDYDPAAPESGEGKATDPARGRPVTHGTPLAPDEYARLKERARRGDTGEGGGPAQHDRADD
jgi:hypothetical protein